MRTKTSNWFEVKMRYDKVHEDGYEKKVTESYVVEALSFGEAEKTAIEFLGSYVSGEIQVVNINPMKFQEVSFNEQESCDRYYSLSPSMRRRREKSIHRFTIWYRHPLSTTARTQSERLWRGP